ncbi:MAG: hypothetical protein V1725_07790 [archaeon]
MPRIVLLEGIATTGKSTVQQLLHDSLLARGYSCYMVPEQQITKTFLPSAITEVKSNAQLKRLFRTLLTRTEEFIIIDRSHFSNISYFKTDFNAFKNIDDLLSKHDARIIMMKFDAKQIVPRIRASLAHRQGNGFVSYFHNLIKDCKSKKEEDEVLQTYFEDGIKSMSDSLKKTRLAHAIVDVTDCSAPSDYEQVIPEITSYVLSD